MNDREADAVRRAFYTGHTDETSLARKYDTTAEVIHGILCRSTHREFISKATLRAFAEYRRKEIENLTARLQAEESDLLTLAR